MKTFDKARPSGYPIWLDLMAPDVKQAAKFYEQVFGWTYLESGPEFGHYHMAQVDGRNAAGMGQAPEGNPMPAAWTVYYSAEDADAMTAQAKALGATVLNEPMDVPGQGRMSIIQDPTGAVFGLWQAHGHIGAGIVESHGAMMWSEVNTRDAQKAIDFYTELLGATAEKYDAGNTLYYVLKKGDTFIGGILQMDENWQGVPPHWMNYFQVDNTDETIERAKQANGELTVPAMDMPIGRMAMLKDSVGAAFAIMQPAQS